MEMENKMITGRDIVIVGLQPWDITIGSNCKNMAMELAKHNRVLYVNRALDRISALRDRNDPKTRARKSSIRKDSDDIEHLSPNLYVLNPRTILESINWIRSATVFDWMNKHNNRSLAREINIAMDRLEFEDVILFNDSDFFRAFYLAEMLPKVNSTIYYLRDYLVSQPYFKRHGTRLEPQLIEKSTLVVANSAYLANYARQFNPNSFDIGQGCDFDQFSLDAKREKPAELEAINESIIGYVGALTTSRLDIDLLYYIASSKPQWKIVLVGPEDEHFEQSELHRLQNVHFLGAKPVNKLADFINAFDVCINPQALNDMTIGNYPRKVDEYLAMGKPVVATATETMQMFAAYASLCNTPEEYVQAIDRILTTAWPEEQRQAAIRFARSHTWEQVIADLSKYFFCVTSKKAA